MEWLIAMVADPETTVTVGNIAEQLGGWDRIGVVGISVLVVIGFMSGRIHPHGTLKRAWEDTDKAWDAYKAERTARERGEAGLLTALGGLDKATSVLDSIKRSTGTPPASRHAAPPTGGEQHAVDSAVDGGPQEV